MGASSLGSSGVGVMDTLRWGCTTEAPESTPCPTLTTLPVFLKHSLLVLDTYEAAVHVCRGLSADGVY
jgi:hypothetical protein